MVVDIESKFRESVEQLSPEHQSLLAKTLLRVVNGEQPDLSELPEPVQAACVIFGLMQLERYTGQQEVKVKEKRDRPILEMAERLLKEMIKANPGIRATELAEDAMQAAQKLCGMG